MTGFSVDSAQSFAPPNLRVSAAERDALSAMVAVPVEYQQGGVIVEGRTGHRQNLVSKLSGRFTWVYRPCLADRRHEVEGRRVAFEHPVGDEHDTIAGLKEQVAAQKFLSGEQAQRQPDHQLRRADLPAVGEVRRNVTGVDQRENPRVRSRQLRLASGNQVYVSGEPKLIVLPSGSMTTPSRIPDGLSSAKRTAGRCREPTLGAAVLLGPARRRARGPKDC